jgi:hypothetical protein
MGGIGGVVEEAPQLGLDALGRELRGVFALP